MATFRLRVSGKVVPVPDGLSLAGAQDFLLTQGLPPEEVGTERVEPDQPTGVEAFDIAAGKFFADRSFGLIPNDAPAPGGVGGFLGSVAPAALAGMVAPGTGIAGILSQGGVAAGLEAIREGSTPQSVAGQGVLGAAGAALGNLASRVVSGITRAGKAAINRAVVAQTDDALRLAAEGTGGARIIEAINRRAINQKAAASIYQQADELTDDVLAKAADDIGQLFDAASPTSYNPAQAFQTLDAIPDSALPGKARILELAKRTDSYTELHRTLRELSRKMARNPTLAAWADEVDVAMGQLEQSAVGADPLMLTRAREGWKNLRLLESMADVVDTGNVPVGRAARVFSDEVRGYGTSYKRGAAAGTQPETRELTAALKTLAAAKGRATSGTAERATATVAGLGILGGLASGELSAEDAAKLIAAGAIVSPALAAASVGAASRGSGAAGSALAQQLLRLQESEQP